MGSTTGIAFLAPYFVVGTWGFTMVLLVGLAILMWLVRIGKSLPATIALVASAMLLCFMAQVRIQVHFSWLGVLEALGIVLGFLAIAGGWAWFYWMWRMRRLAEKCEEIKYNFLRLHEITNMIIPEELRAKWESYARIAIKSLDGVSIGPDGKFVKPHPNDHKSQIYLWMMFWPLSMAWFIFDEAICKIFSNIYKFMRESMVQQTERAFAKVQSDFEFKSTDPGPKGDSANKTDPPVGPAGSGAAGNVSE